MSNRDLIAKGVCPHCRKIVYNPDSQLGQPHEMGFSLAVGLHAAKCPENPDYTEDEIEKYIREILSGE